MPYQLQIQQHRGYLHVFVSGANTAEVVRSYLHEVLEICATRRCAAVLLEENLTGPPMNLAEIYSIASEGSGYRLARLLKVAFVNSNREHPIANMKFAETVARNRGVNVRIFPAVAEARAWLLER
jgi:hypothetical protein